MIYSAADDNFLRVKLMFEIAYSLQKEKKGIEAKRDPKAKGILVRAELDTEEVRQKERAIIEAILTFTVITLESLVNQALAENINNVSLACLAIEYPKQITEKTHKKLNNANELLHKLTILADQATVPEEIAESSRNLVAIRNQVVHDKPFYFEIDSEGDVTYIPYTLRYTDKAKQAETINYLVDWFASADLIVEYINSMADVGADFRFGSLFQGLEA